MASITIRQLDEQLKKNLRLRAARNGRSMEDEVRTILRAATGGDNVRPDAASIAVRSESTAGPVLKPQEAAVRQLLLIIGGGIAAYKSLELIRRLKERGFLVRAILTQAGSEFVTPLSVASLCGE